MTATFTVPDLPGSAVNFVGVARQTVQPNFADVVALPIVHDWGPVGVPVLCTSFADFESRFGTDASAGRNAVLSAFSGGGVPGEGGAGGVVVIRTAGSAKAKGTKVLTNTTPATALTLTAKYEGTLAANIAVTVDDDPAVTGNDRLRVYVSGVKVKEYSYVQTDITGLAAQINAVDQYLTAVSAISGVALTAVSNQALTGGNDGSTLTTQNWLDALAALEFEDFSILAYSGVDDTIRATIVAWVQTMASNYKPVALVVGGDTSDTASTAIARSAAIANEHVVNLGVGVWHDDLLGADLSTAQIAPRVAGILAARGLTASLTFAKLGGLSLVSGAPDNATLKALRDNGVTAFRRVSVVGADLVVSQGVTTFTSKADASRAYQVFSDPRKVRVHDVFIRNMKAWGDENIIGDVTVTDDSRAAVRGYARGLINDYLTAGIILPGNPSLAPPIPEPYIRTPVTNDPALAGAIPYEFGWQHADTALYVIGNGLVS